MYSLKLSCPILLVDTGRLTYVCATCEEHFTRKTSATRHNNITYQVRVTNITGVIGAYLQKGLDGQNGPIYTSISSSTIPPTGKVNGILSKGVIKATDLRGLLLGKRVGDLTALMNSEATARELYVNIHTQQNKKGEIRCVCSLPKPCSPVFLSFY